MSLFPEEPFLVPEFSMVSGGLDFLGMRQATLDLRDACLPGFSNSTRYVRPFSLMCWTFWKLYSLMDKAGLDVLTSEQAVAFREKVEVLFTWGHQLNQMGGLPGITAKPPQMDSDVTSVPVTFKAWRRKPSSTGLMAAVNYGPALKTTSGFGFLNPVASERFQPLAKGVALAEGLEEALLKHGIPALLETLEAKSATREDALRAFDGWKIDAPSELEQITFRSVLYDGGTGTDAGRSSLSLRSATFDLILEVLKRADGSMDVAEIREAMFLGPQKLPQMNLTMRSKAARERWILLQVRQAQRLAMEALLSWIEKRILYDGARHTSDLARAGEEICRLDPNFKDLDWLCFAQNHKGSQFLDLNDAVQASAESEEISLFHRMDELVNLIHEEKDEVFSFALALLGLCREYAVALHAIPELRSGLSLGGSEGLSLNLWSDVCEAAASATSYDFLLMVIEELVLSRHFGVATRRYDGNLIRLRIAIEEEGLVALISEPWKPLPAQDKLASGLSLLADCGLIARAGDGYTSSSDGPHSAPL